MYRIAICDSDKAFTKVLYQNLLSWKKKEGIIGEIRTFHESQSLLEDILEYGCYQIVFVDVKVDGNRGLSLAAAVNGQHQNTLIIFMAAHESYIRQVYRIHHYYFLLKPFSRKELYSVMGGAVNELELYHQEFRFSYQKVFYAVPLNDIMYFYSEKRRICIVCQEYRNYWFYDKLDRIEERLRQKTWRFIRIHQSYFINIKYIREYCREFVEMFDQEQLPISQARRTTVHRLLSRIW